jgi:hypothetical protein
VAGVGAIGCAAARKEGINAKNKNAKYTFFIAVLGDCAAGKIQIKVLTEHMIEQPPSLLLLSYFSIETKA